MRIRRPLSTKKKAFLPSSSPAPPAIITRSPRRALNERMCSRRPKTPITLRIQGALLAVRSLRLLQCPLICIALSKVSNGWLSRTLTKTLLHFQTSWLSFEAPISNQYPAISSSRASMRPMARQMPLLAILRLHLPACSSQCQTPQLGQQLHCPSPTLLDLRFLVFQVFGAPDCHLTSVGPRLQERLQAWDNIQVQPIQQTPEAQTLAMHPMI
jgi:hypothetical protein